MTWQELKDYIDSKVTPSAKISFIDLRHPDNSHPSTEVDIEIDTQGSVAIYN